MSRDTLSDLLRSVRVRGAVFYYVSCRAPWSAEAPPAREIAAAVMPGCEHVMEYHMIARGSGWAAVAGQAPVRLAAGDIVMFPQGDGHVLSSAPEGVAPLRRAPEWVFATRDVPKPLPIAYHHGVVEAGAPLPVETADMVAVCGFLGCDLRPFNPLVAAASRAYQDRLSALETPDQRTQISLQGSALWLRQGDAQGQMVIRAQSVEPDGLGFADVSFLVFERETGQPLLRIEAERARLEPGHWQLHEVKRWDLGAPNPEREAETFARLDLPSDLTGARIRESFARAGMVSIWALPDFIAALDRSGLSSRSYRAQFMAELALPILLGAMMMVGTVLCLRHSRTGGTGMRVLATVLAGFLLFFLRNFAQVLGENGQIPLWLAIWTPPLASMLLAVGVLLHLEDG